MKDAQVRSKLEQLRLSASTPAEREQIERIIAIFEAAPEDETPAEVLIFLNDLGLFTDEDGDRAGPPS